ncbi:1-phosphatidylinositol 4,5-bisphosphate phosphodiesterase eta-2-like isoform X1 [Tigriopus californicus]|uniref:1-phosphatidylinositol 4,5-bisphosphate phosphodiesterase eta-2-like isoform X1 n=2 Tax=Tigriopus californicus TaxID=6832 RepID=UPI0027DA3597|nr:1-phosphatidylinositol 4,5-bisphosphate phosphodiesterase eta-2-like isoform X1 [Tigriopus californicus]
MEPVDEKGEFSDCSAPSTPEIGLGSGSPPFHVPSPRLLRFKSVRTKPKSFSAWKESVRSACSDDDLEILVRGCYLWKIRKKTFQGITCYRRRFYLNLDTLSVEYVSEPRRFSLTFAKDTNLLSSSPAVEMPATPPIVIPDSDSKHSIDIANIVEVRRGFATDTFNVVEKKAHTFKALATCLKAENCFSLIFDSHYRTPSLDLVAEDQKICNSWVANISRIINATKSIEIQKDYELYLRNQFHTADENHNGNLTLNEFSGLLQQLNINLTEKEICAIFDEVNTNRTEIDGEQVIDEQEFLEFYHNLLERDELIEIFQNYSYCYDGLAMTLSELKKFLEIEQHCVADDEECRQIINEFEPCGSRRSRLLLSPEGFSRFFMFSDSNDLIDHSKIEHVYQNMNHSLSHYFISTSHNTYLVGNQVTSESSIDGYIRALKAGCRCVELDCWDGPRSEPIIYHGWTLTSKLDFKEVLIDAVRPYAFYSSEYPLILSIENHCSKKQQEKMAEHLTAILGDMLYVQEVDRTRTHLPSPNELKRKILIKAKKIQSPNSMNQQHFECPEQHVQTLPSILYSNPLHQHYSKRKHSDSVGSVDTVSKRFSDLVNYMESTKFRGFEVPRRYWEMSSFEESKAVQVAASSPEKFVNYNRRNLSRIYPRGTRLFSSNFDPLPLWLVGCQMVALNYQAKDRRLMFNRAMFRQNGRCGYILKPTSLRDGKSSPDPKVLQIKIISGQHLPKSEQRIKGDIIEPYVKVRVRGYPEDEAEYVTKVIPKNGFNPVWAEVAKFHIRHPDFAFIEFRVKNHVDSSTSPDEYLASYVIPVDLMRQGFRHVQLVNLAGIRLTPATLFVHVEISPVENKRKNNATPPTQPL